MKLLILALTVSAVYASTFQVGLNFKPSQDKRQLYSSKLLHHVQMSRIFPDSKTFVDMHMKRDEKTILHDFDELLAKTNERPTKEQLADFISYNFDSESGLESWRPSDFVSEPGFLNSIKDSQLKQFARNVYSILPTLGRKIKPVVFKNPEQFSMIPVHNGFIVPGGNFKEFNYMESYWIIESLLISGMKETAKGMISNFIELQREFGYIPSGDRYYYLGRSQPPLLSAMMAIYLQETNDIEFLRANIDAIEGELEYWLDTHSVVFDVAGREYSLLRYITQCRGPRPEEYYHDFTNAQVFDNEQRQEQFYTDMKAAAESGWVMSSRWIMNKNGSNLGDLSWMHTTDVVPVDLNAIFASAVQNVAHFYSVLNDARRGAHWLEIRKRWVNSIKEVLWNEKEGMWFDWDLSSSQHRKYFYTSNLSPLWMGVVEPEFMKAKSQPILNYLRRTHSLEYPGGVPASLTKSGYLYDLPYAYPAQVSIVVSALEALQTEEASKMAFEVAQNLVRSMYKAYQTNKQLYAYYDVETPGKPFIASGEYFNEEAFGGTIGVIIEMLAKYGATMTSVRGFLPFPSKFGQYSQFYSTSAPQIVNHQYSTFPAKPFVSVAKPESPIKPVYTNEYKKPSVAPTYFAQTTYSPSEPTKPTLAEVHPEHIVSVEKKPEVTTLKDEEYISTTYKPEYITSAPIKPYQPIQTEAKVDAVPVYNKPSYTTFVPQKPALVTEVKPEVVPTKPVYTSFGSKPQYFASVKPTYVAPAKPVPTLPTNKFELPVSKPTYVAPQPLKHEYVSVEAKPEPQLLEKKPEYLSVSPVPQKPEYLSVEAKPEPQLPVAPVPLKNEFISVEAKPEPQLLEKKPEYLPVAPTPLKPEPELIKKNPEYLAITPVPQKPELLPVAPVPQKPAYLPVAPVQQKPTYLPVAPVPQKPEYLPVAPVPQKPLYVSVQAKPESQLNKKPEYVSVVETKPEVVPTANPAKPSYTSSIVSKPEYVSVQAKPESVLIEKKPEYIPAAEVKPEVVATVYNKPLYPTPAPVKPAFVIEPKPQVAPTKYPAQPLYFKPVQNSYVAPLSLKPEYVSVEAKPESQLPEKKPEYVTEEIISSTTLEPEYVSTTAQPEQVTLIPTKPEQVTLYPAKPEQVALYPAKPTQVFYPAKPAQVSVYAAKPTFSSFPSWPKYTTSVKVPFVSAVKPLNNVQAKPEYIPTTEFQQEEVATTFAPIYEATTTSKPEQQYPAKPAYVASLPIKQEYVHSEASLPAKEVDIQTSPVKPVYGSQQTVYVSSPKPFFAPTKLSIVAAVPLQAQQVSHTSSSYRQPGYSVPAISESKYTTSYPSAIEYESSTVAETEYTTAAGEYTTYKPEYTTAAEPEYTTLHSQFEYATTESQLDATVKPQNVYVSVQSKPQAAALTIGGSASTEKKPYFAGYSTISSQKQEVPKVQTTYVSSVQSQASGLAELTPVVSVSIPAKQQAQGQIASQDQATVLQQSHFSYFDKPAPVVVVTQPPVVATQPPKTEGFTSFTKLNINSGSASKVESGSTNTVVSSKPQFSFGTFGSGYVFNKTVTPSYVTSTVDVTGISRNNQKWPQTGQYSWQGSNYNNNKPFSYYSSYKPNRWNSYPGQYQGQYQTGQYQSGQYKGQYQGQYNTGLYRPTVSSTTFKPLYSSSTVKPVSAAVLAALA